MAEAVYWAIDESGLRLPSRRDIARRAHVSEATISRRFKDSVVEERLAATLVSARERTYPPDFSHDGWHRWLPESEAELKDLRVWLACLAFASQSSTVADAVRAAWQHERRSLQGRLGLPLVEADEESPVIDALQALILGLSLRRVLDPELSHARALSLLEMVAGSWGRDGS